MKGTMPVLCVFDYLGMDGKRPAWFQDAIMVEVQRLDQVEEEFERRMELRRTTHGSFDVGPKPSQWRLRGILTRDDVQRHH